MKKLSFFSMIISTTVLLSNEPNRVKFHGSIEALPAYLNPDDNSKVTLADDRTYTNFQFPKRSWFYGITIPVYKNYKFGLDLMQIVWTSYYRNEYDVSAKERFAPPADLTFGRSNILFPHWLIGPSINLSWSLNSDTSLWTNTTFTVGNFWGEGRSGGSESVPFIRIERPIINKFRHIVVAQVSNIPNNGLTTSLQIGFDSNLLFWKR